MPPWAWAPRCPQCSRIQPAMNRAATHPAIGTSRTQQQPKDRPSFRCRPDRDSGIPICRESRAWAWETPRARFQEKLKPGIPRRRDIWTPMGIAKPTPSRMEECVGICGRVPGSMGRRRPPTGPRRSCPGSALEPLDHQDAAPGGPVVRLEAMATGRRGAGHVGLRPSRGTRKCGRWPGSPPLQGGTPSSYWGRGRR